MNELELRIFLAILKKSTVPYTFLQTLCKLNNPANRHINMKDTIEVQVYSGGANKAIKAVGRLAAGTEVDKMAKSPVLVKLPRFRPKKMLNIEDLGILLMPTNTTNGLKEVVTMRLSDEMSDLKSKVVTMWEIALGQLMTTGKIEIDVEDSEDKFTLDLGSASGNFEEAEAAELWSGNGSKLEFLRKKEKKIMEAGYKPDILIMGSEAGLKFLSDDDVKKMLNTQATTGAMRLQGLDVGGYRYLGEYDGKSVYTYEAKYTDTAGNAKDYIDPKRIVLTSSLTPFSLEFGPIGDTRNIEGRDVAMEFFVKSWEQEDPSGRYLLVESDSIPVTTDIRGIYSAKVL